ncbi:MAG: hypothetical protein ABIG91_01845 [Patescibacteria group bacterium]
MKKEELIKKIKEINKKAFTANDLKSLFPNDSRLINTYIKRFKDANVITPITRGLYMITNDTIDIEKLATSSYYPSYISFESALSKYGIINQGLYKITLATTRHSKKVTLLGTECEYSKINKDLFFGFNLMDGVYIAEPEKAFLDMLYLVALGKRKTNYNEWCINSLNHNKLTKYAKLFGKATEKLSGKILGKDI